MSQESGAKKIAGYAFLVAFANDDTIDQAELEMIKRIALEDRKVDDDEKHVLRNIFSAVCEDTVDPKVWREITEFREKYDI
ncbi:MAG: hypothetical protein MI757_07055 [Pirellulales bacterium]|nr:hypothetical protein [Pirellulales bacterium]